MNNFISYEYNQIKPSNLTSKIIIMIGRADDQMKRLELGIFAMKFIIKEIECEMKIISKIDERNNLKRLVKGLNLEKYIKFVGYTSTPEIYFKNASLHIFPTISESFGLVLCETKIYGIPNILLGLDYVSFANGGTVIIYNDEPETIAKEAIKILKNERYRNKLGQEARESMKKLRNIVTLKKWIKLLLAVFNGENNYKELIYQDKKISEAQAINIIRRQLILLKKRKKNYKNFTLNNIKNFTFIKNFLFFN
jgi:glycosyltransferase involved in cell wall biosynthesis